MTDNLPYDDAFRQHAVTHVHKHNQKNLWREFMAACLAAKVRQPMYGEWLAVGKPASPAEFWRLWEERKIKLNANKPKTTPLPGRGSSRASAHQKNAGRGDTPNRKGKAPLRDAAPKAKAKGKAASLAAEEENLSDDA